MSSKLLDTLVTKEDVALLQQELAALQASLFRTGSKDFKNTLKISVRSWVADIIQDELKKDPDHVEDFIKNLSSEIEQKKVLELTLAFEPTSQNLENIHHWLQDHQNGEVVIDVHVDRRIVGGAVIVINGKYHDFSLRNKLDMTLEKVLQENILL